MKKRGLKERKRSVIDVYRSSKYIYAQIIDPKGKSLVSASQSELVKTEGIVTKSQKAGKVGEILAEKALKKGIKTVAFNRKRYKYHGRVSALAQGARNKGLIF